MFRKTFAALAIAATFALPASPAFASPDTDFGGASIESGNEPRDVGASIEDGSDHRTVGAAIDDASKPRPDVLIPLDKNGNPILTKAVK